MPRPLTTEEQKRSEAALQVVKKLGKWISKRNPTVPREDLEAVGREAIVIAASKYDPGVGPFEAYAYNYARGEMLNYARKTLRTRSRETNLRSLVEGMETNVLTAGQKFDLALESTEEMEHERMVDQVRNRIAGACVELMLARSAETDGEADHLQRRAIALGHRVLEQVLEGLGEPDKTFYVRFFREERSIPEIAAELKVSVRTGHRIAERVRMTVDNAVRAARIV